MMTADFLPHEKGFQVSWEQLHYDARKLALQLQKVGSELHGNWRAMIAITRGGLVPAMIVSRELNIRIVDSISVKSYDYQSQSAPKILKLPDPEVIGDGEAVLMVDDLVDSGKTLELVRERFPNAHYATLYAKPEGRPMVDTFIKEVSQNTWIYFPWDMALQYVDPYRPGA